MFYFPVVVWILIFRLEPVHTWCLEMMQILSLCLLWSMILWTRLNPNKLLGLTGSMNLQERDLEKVEQTYFVDVSNLIDYQTRLSCCFELRKRTNVSHAIANVSHAWNWARTTDTQWMHKSKKPEILGRCGRQNMLRLYL